LLVGSGERADEQQGEDKRRTGQGRLSPAAGSREFP
jgi:hypothetical protein